jgi:predicted nucleic acid-binding protein
VGRKIIKTTFYFMYLLDTNTIIHYLNASLPPSAMLFMHTVVDEQSNISVISKIETLGYNFTDVAEKNTMEAFVNASSVLPINDEVVNQTIALRKSRKIKLPDALIAATALVYNLTLLTNNTTDFKNINGITCIDPWEQ